jgi:type I restriction enzyme, S subunit
MNWIKQLFSFVDQLEARYVNAQAHVDNLTQFLLAKAFRGELAPAGCRRRARRRRS